MKLPRQKPVLFSYQSCEPLKQCSVESHTYPFLPGNFVSANWLKLFERLGGSRDWIIGQCQAESPSKRKTGSIRLLGLTIDAFHGSNMLGQGHAVRVAQDMLYAWLLRAFRYGRVSARVESHPRFVTIICLRHSPCETIIHFAFVNRAWAQVAPLPCQSLLMVT